MIDWLEKIGMGKYKNIFLENELRVYLLSDVTKEQWAKWIPNEKDRKVIIDTINKTAGHSHTPCVHEQTSLIFTHTLSPPHCRFIFS